MPAAGGVYHTCAAANKRTADALLLCQARCVTFVQKVAWQGLLGFLPLFYLIRFCPPRRED